VMQPSAVMYQASVTPYEQGASFPQCPPGVFTVPQGMLTGSNPQLGHANCTVKAPDAPFQQGNPLPQNQNGVVFMQMMVPVPVYDQFTMQAPTSTQQVVGPQGSLSFADPWGQSGSACKGSMAKHSRAAALKKFTGSPPRLETVQQLKDAVQDETKLQSNFTVARRCSNISQCSTVEGLSDGDANSDLREISRQTT